MKTFTIGIMMSILLVTSLFLFIGAKPAEEDSIKMYLEQLESFLRTELAKSEIRGRYQLQSFSIDRTHWHYMLDTASGELYRMELGRTPDRSEWILMSKGIAEEEPVEYE
ncbi:MAG: hypothetical protein IIB44_09490 [Candidatus Marinimicrobia bacterium]|nr:hypothetical protein [Candidatus Neomarinimicrobiota bacterium]